MEYVVICSVTVAAAALTLFSGFGLGTLLMPALALFFPIPVAIGATAVVHLANNLFKVVLVGRHADRATVVRFAIPGAVAAVFGAWLLASFADVPPLFGYALGDRRHDVTAVELVIGVLIVAFALLDLVPRFASLSFDRKYLPLGGLVSGFFGGLSGNQGALRSAFLIKAGLDKEAFIGTGTVSAVIVDVARLLVYGLSATRLDVLAPDLQGLVSAAIVAAFLGSYLGVRLVGKVTLRTVQRIVGVMLIAVGCGMASGLL